MLGISAATGSRVAWAPTRMPAIAASPSTASTGSSRTVSTTSAANSLAGPQMNRSRANTNWRNTFRRSMSAIGAVDCGQQKPHGNASATAPGVAGAHHPPHPVDHLQLGEDVGAVVADRLETQHEFAADVGIAAVGSNKADYLVLALGEFGKHVRHPAAARSGNELDRAPAWRLNVHDLMIARRQTRHNADRR